MAREWKPPPVGVMRAANRVIVPLLSSPLHGLASHRLMLLEFAGLKSGRQYVIPVAYYDWAAGEVLAISTRPTWPRNLRGGQPARLCIRGRWHQAKPTIVEDADGVAAVLNEFVARFGPKATAKLRLGLPVDRAPSAAELVVVAGRAKVGRFHLVDSIQP
jgi:hypothetical protein